MQRIRCKKREQGGIKPPHAEMSLSRFCIVPRLEAVRQEAFFSPTGQALAVTKAPGTEGRDGELHGALIGSSQTTPDDHVARMEGNDATQCLHCLCLLDTPKPHLHPLHALNDHHPSTHLHALPNPPLSTLSTVFAILDRYPSHSVSSIPHRRPAPDGPPCPLPITDCRQ